jgi:hypothetical protein
LQSHGRGENRIAEIQAARADEGEPGRGNGERTKRQQHFWGGCAHLKKSPSAAV